jgi:hypothetical protein
MQTAKGIVLLAKCATTREKSNLLTDGVKTLQGEKKVVKE